MNPFQDHPTVQLLAEGAVFLSDSRTLVVADVHLGKSAAFRAKGVPVPEGDTAVDLRRMLELARRHQAAQLVVAGDLFHAPAGITEELDSALNRFVAKLEIPFTLVAGNHDRKIRRLPAQIPSVSQIDLGDVCIVHDPDHANGDSLHLTGHWHPMVRIPDGRRTSLRLPAFVRRHQVLVMPAFGSFTGGAMIQPQQGDRFFVGHIGKIIELPPELVAAR
jgi:DNA ligase-associated metallophosphoesterase